MKNILTIFWIFVELQWHVNQNKIVVGFLWITFYLLGKVTSLLCENFAFSVIASESSKSSLLDTVRRRLKTWSPYKSEGSQAHVCKHVCLNFPIMP